VLHFEGKIWRTLPLLAFRPGILTRRYIAGERARFVSPMALFLFSVFLMFAVFSLVIGPVDFGGTTSGRNLQAGMEEAARQDEAKIAVLERRRVAAITSGQSTAAIDRELKRVREEAAVVAAMAERGVVEGAAERMADDVPDAPGWFNDAYKKAKANPSLLIYKLQNNAYKFSWALIPLSVPFPVAAVSIQPPLPDLRSHRLRHLFFVLHDLARNPAQPAGRDRGQGRLAGVRRARVAADPHVQAAEARLPPHPLQRRLARDPADSLRNDRGRLFRPPPDRPRRARLIQLNPRRDISYASVRQTQP
jgi:hypothetical protein